jgi:hypothetical protein
VLNISWTSPLSKMLILEGPDNDAAAFRAKSKMPVTRRAIGIQGDRLVVHFEGVYATFEIDEVD